MSKQLNNLVEQLQALERESEVLEAQLSTLGKREREIKLEIVGVKYGVTVGSIVDYKGVKHRVTHINPRWLDSKRLECPWLSGNPMKKDGTWGKADKALYSSWTVSSS